MHTFNKLTTYLGGKSYDEKGPAREDTSNIGYCPLHESKKRNLKYKKHGNSSFEFHCHDGCSSFEIEDLLKNKGILNETNGFEGFEGRDFKISQIFESSDNVSLDGPVNKYLKVRGINGVNSNTFIRENLGFDYYENGKVITNAPAMISRIFDVKQGLTIGCHITYLNEQGRKAKVNNPKKILGRLKNGVVKIQGENEDHIILTEGIENALTISQAFGVTVFATLSAYNLKLDFIPEDISGKKIIIYVDKDRSMAGERYAIEAKSYYEDNYNVQVALKYPECPIPAKKKGIDFNDLIQKGLTLDEKFSPFQHQKLEKFFSNLKNKHSKPSIPPIEPKFDIGKMVPKILSIYLIDESQRLSIQPEALYITLITSFSSIVGRRYAIQPKDKDPSWKVVPTLWCLLVNHPSTRKSATIKSGTRFLEEIQRNHLKSYRELEQDRQVKKEILEEQEKQIKKKLNDDPENSDLIDELVQIKTEIKKIQLGPRRYIFNDSTVEKVISLAESNPNGLTMVRDELGGFIGQLNKKGYEGAREFYLEGWNGSGTYTKDTLSRGTNFVDGLALNIITGTQPDTFLKLIRESKNGKDDGFTQRFQLLNFPDSIEYNFVNRAIDIRSYQEIQNIFEEFDSIEPNAMKMLKLSTDSQIAFAKFCEWINNSSFRNRLLKTHISKFDSLVAKLSLLYELIENGPNATEVSKDSLDKAINFSYFLASHADRLFNLAEDHSNELKPLLLKKIEENQITFGMTLREIKQKGWKGIFKGETLNKSLSDLENDHILTVKKKESPQGGRPSEKILVNPLFSYFT